MKVLAIPEVRLYLQNLAVILYEKEFFGFEDSARRYVIELFEDIKKTLPRRQHKPAPKYFDKYGKDMEYAVFKKSNHTSWYIFFTIYEDEATGEDIFLIRYIGNNHTVAQYL
jgi:hypothetical protein